MSINESLILNALIRIQSGLMGKLAYKVNASERKFLEKFEVDNDSVKFTRILPAKCDPEKCGCGETHWFRFQIPAAQIDQADKNKLFAISGRFA